MATMTIKKLPDDLYERLRASAERHRRSMNAEAIVCLQRGLGVAAVDPEDLLAGLRSVRERARDLYVTDAELDAARRRGRP
ncbi:MAG: Arc family DNA-binding protein [Gemmatimonadetes bacterium]|nr:Arc family DNA-binding protein [Gemmatimonadota bacterium]